MIIRCNFLTYDSDDFEDNRVTYGDDPSKAPSILTPGAIDLSEIHSVTADSDRMLNKKLGQLTSVAMKSGITHVIDIPTELLIEAWAKVKNQLKISLN